MAKQPEYIDKDTAYQYALYEQVNWLSSIDQKIEVLYQSPIKPTESMSMWRRLLNFLKPHKARK